MEYELLLIHEDTSIATRTGDSQFVKDVLDIAERESEKIIKLVVKPVK